MVTDFANLRNWLLDYELWEIDWSKPVAPQIRKQIENTEDSPRINNWDSISPKDQDELIDTVSRAFYEKAQRPEYMDILGFPTPAPSPPPAPPPGIIKRAWGAIKRFFRRG